KQLLEIQRKSKHVIQEKEKELQDLKKAVESHKHSAQTAVQETEMIFTQLIKYFEGRLSEATRLISAQEKAAVTRAEEVSKRLEKEILELKKRDAKMEELSNIDDPTYYLQIFQSVTVGVFTLPTITLSPVLTFEDVIKSVSQLKEKLEELCKSKFEKIPKGVTDVQIVPPPLPTFQPSHMKLSTTEPKRGINSY
ncbi:E3 ubiquitin/ISG15 ligase TRIM25-like, partial [Clarias magur]